MSRSSAESARFETSFGSETGTVLDGLRLAANDAIRAETGDQQEERFLQKKRETAALLAMYLERYNELRGTIASSPQLEVLQGVHDQLDQEGYKLKIGSYDDADFKTALLDALALKASTALMDLNNAARGITIEEISSRRSAGLDSGTTHRDVEPEVADEVIDEGHPKGTPPSFPLVTLDNDIDSLVSAGEVTRNERGILPPSELQEKFTALHNKHAEIVELMSGLVEQTESQNINYNSALLAAFNKTTVDIEQREEQVFEAVEQSLTYDDYSRLAHELEAMVKTAELQYDAFLADLKSTYGDVLEFSDGPEPAPTDALAVSAEQLSTDRTPTEALVEPEKTVSPEVLEALDILEKANKLLLAISRADLKAKSSTFAKIAQAQKNKLDETFTLLADESNNRSISNALSKVISAEDKNNAGSKVLLKNRLATLKKNLKQLGTAYSFFMEEDDRQLFTTDEIITQPISKDSDGTGAKNVLATNLALQTTPEVVGPVIDVKAENDSSSETAEDVAANLDDRDINLIDESEKKFAEANEQFTLLRLALLSNPSLFVEFATTFQEIETLLSAETSHGSVPNLIKRLQIHGSQAEKDTLIDELASAANRLEVLVSDLSQRLSSFLVTADEEEVLHNREIVKDENLLDQAVADHSPSLEESQAEVKRTEVQHLTEQCVAICEQFIAEFAVHKEAGDRVVDMGLADVAHQVTVVQQLTEAFIAKNPSDTDYQAQYELTIDRIQKRLQIINHIGTYLRGFIENRPLVTDSQGDAPAVASTDNDKAVRDKETMVQADQEIIPAFDEEVLYAPLPKTRDEINVRVEAIAAECGRIQALIGATEEMLLINQAIQACRQDQDEAINNQLPLKSLKHLINVAEPLIRNNRTYLPSTAELVARRERESDFDIYKYPEEAHYLVQGMARRIKKLQSLKQKVWKLEQAQVEVTTDIRDSIARAEKMLYGDNSIDAILWQIRSDHEENKKSLPLIHQLDGEVVRFDLLLEAVDVTLDPSQGQEFVDSDFGSLDELNEILDGTETAEETIAKEQARLDSIQRQIENLISYKTAKGEILNPDLQRILSAIESARNEQETDPIVKSHNFDVRYRSIIKEWNGADKRSGLYFNVLTPEERLVTAGLPPVPEASRAQKLEDGDSYTQALVTYRLARQDFMGGTRKANPGEITADGSEYIKDAGLKAEYEQKLQEFYTNPGRWNKIKNTFGFKPKLTPELEAMRSEYDTARVAYARTLQAVLAVRGTRAEGNKEFLATGEKTKKAFGQKFVLDEFKQQQKIQAEALAGEKNETIQKILEVMRKHKWTMRGLTVIGAGVVAGGGLAALGIGAAALSGTAAVMGSATVAARMAAVIGLGGAFGKAAHVKFQKGVDAARDDLSTAEAAVLADFSVDTMNLSQVIVERSAERLDSARRTQKVATFAAAAAPGGVVGAAHILDVLTSTPLVESTLAKPFEVAPAVPDRPTMVVEKIDFTGKGLNKDAVPSGEWASLTKSAELKVADLLATRPHLTEVEVEKLVLEKIQTEFGNRPWWDSANVDAVDITISKRLFGAIPLTPDTATQAMPTPPSYIGTEAESVSEAVANAGPASPASTEAGSTVSGERPAYTVRPNDTLSKITLEQFKDSGALNGLTPAEQKAAIYELMDRAKTDPVLRATIGLRGGDIDLIYPEQKIDLTGLEAELKTIVAEEAYKLPEVQSHVTTGKMNVATLDSETSTIPIKVAALANDFAIVDQPMPNTVPRPAPLSALGGGEMIQTVYKIPDTAKLFSMSGNYLETPEYRALVTSVFGSIEKFNRAVDFEVTKFERGTYDALDRLMGTDVYLSPYKEFSNLTMAEIDLKRAELENMQNQYKTFGGQNTPKPFGEVGQMKYETYRASVDKLDELKRAHPGSWSASTKLSDFIGRVVAEARVAELNKSIKTGPINLDAANDRSKLLQA